MNLFTSRKSEETPRKSKPRLVIAALVLMLGMLISCGPEVQNESITDDSGSVTAGDVEPGPDGQPVVEEDDLDDDSLMKDESPNEGQPSPTESE